jgi:hypothetical protein
MLNTEKVARRWWGTKSLTITDQVQPPHFMDEGTTAWKGNIT